jgi:hypothetical protein
MALKHTDFGLKYMEADYEPAYLNPLAVATACFNVACCAADARTFLAFRAVRPLAALAAGCACGAFGHRKSPRAIFESVFPACSRRASACFSGCKPQASGWNAGTQARRLIFSQTANGWIWYFFLSLFVSRNPLNALVRHAACRRIVHALRCIHGE